MRRSTVRTPLPWLGALLAVYLLGPLAYFAAHAGGAAPAGIPGDGAAVFTSAETATLSTLLAAVFGIPLAYSLARPGALRGLLSVAVQLPLALPPLVGGLLLLQLVGPYTLLGRLTGGRLTDDLAGIVIAQVFVSAPFLVVAARSSFAALDPTLTETAATLGHGPWSRFCRVALPAAAPGIAAGLLLCWLRAFGEFGATVLLAYHPYTLPVLAFVQFSAAGPAATDRLVAAGIAVAGGVLIAGSLALALARRRRPAPGEPAGTDLEPAGPAADWVAPRAAPPVRLQVDARAGRFPLAAATEAAGGRLAVLGPSGAGKTTLLRAIAGLTGGEVSAVVGGEELARRPAEARRVGYVPQEAGLFPARTVWAQITFARDHDPAAARHWVDRLGLSGLEGRRPEELSGGQRRRVALARALAARPRLLLLDEPFAGLDAAVHARLRTVLRELQQETGLPTVLVTHDPADAGALSDHVVVLLGGRVIQQGGLPELTAHPVRPEVAALLGGANLLAGRVDADGRLRAGGLELAAGLPANAEVVWSIPADRLRIVEGPAGRLVDTWSDGRVFESRVRLAGGPALTVRAGSAPPVPVGGHCGVELDPGAVRVWPASGPTGTGPEPAGRRAPARPPAARSPA